MKIVQLIISEFKTSDYASCVQPPADTRQHACEAYHLLLFDTWQRTASEKYLDFDHVDVVSSLYVKIACDCRWFSIYRVLMIDK